MKEKKSKSNQRQLKIKKIKKFFKKIDISKNKFNTLELILIFIMALVLGILMGEMIFGGSSSNTSITQKQDEYLNEIKSVYKTLTNEYIESVDKKALKEAAIDAMISTLKDKHSDYYTEEESKSFEEKLSGSFYGMGAEIYQDQTSDIIVNRVFENSPAEKAGLKQGDKYLKINGKDITNKSLNEISNIVKKNNKTFTLTIERNNKQKILKITTGKVEIPSVSSKIIEKNNKKIGYIALSIFADNTDEQFEKHLKKIEKQNINKLIIDVRSNSGGELNTVINVASNFLNKDDVIVQTQLKNKVTKKYAKKNNDKKYEIVVLINGNSASGSEVLASALNENINAELVGTTTYGKGTVQKVKKLSNGTMIKYTTEIWKTSKGKQINEKGVKPTIEVKLSDKYYETMDEDDDNQLQKAIEILENK